MVAQKEEVKLRKQEDLTAEAHGQRGARRDRL